MEDRLYKFVRLVESQSFTKAAALLHISQPALTTAVKKLERELHAELLVRSSHAFTLTAAGQIAYDAAKELSVHTHNLKLRLQEAANEKVALNLGMIDSIADLLFVQGDHLHELEAGTRLSLTVNNSTQLIKQVAQDELDAALVAAPAHIPQNLTAELVAEEPLVLVSSNDLADATKRDLKSKRLLHFLGYNQNSQTYSLIERHFGRQGIAVSPTFYSTSPEIMLQLVLAGKGTAVLPYLLVKRYIKNERLIVIHAGGTGIITRRIVSLHRNGRTIPKSVDQLLLTAQTTLARLRTETKEVVAHRQILFT